LKQQELARLDEISRSALGVSPDGGVQRADLQSIEVHPAREIHSFKPNFVVSCFLFSLDKDRDLLAESPANCQLNR
jgi:hypothetical protein